MKEGKTELEADNRYKVKCVLREESFRGIAILFVLGLIPLTLVLRKVTSGYNLGNGLPTINHLLFMDDLTLYGKGENKVATLLQSVRVVSKDIKMELERSWS